MTLPRTRLCREEELGFRARVPGLPEAEACRVEGSHWVQYLAPSEWSGVALPPPAVEEHQ